ncbi:related to BNS1 protein [Phialocephala subalpina]|uniref:Related to BNS1 protein n=1 Tax=Phialocephala subalpina TaxID=576137 RepID=A0A1L7X2H9_9HELO|nr:related to BNS1 protein [Phialocephala subalpina]
MSSNVLADRDVNAAVDAKPVADVKSMEYHRQVLQSKLEENQGKQTYISPSDTIMSPCTAKLSAYRSKQVGKAKPKSLFAKTSSKNLGSSSLFGGQIPKSETEDSKMDG